jgi:hypothetical protein
MSRRDTAKSEVSGAAVATAAEAHSVNYGSRGLKIVKEYRATHQPRYRSEEQIVDLVRRIRDGEPL